MITRTPMRSQPEIRNIFERVKNARTDPAVGIRIVKVTGDDLQGLYVAELGSQSRITAHYHQAGSEIYHIVNGEGKIYTGKPISCDEIVWNSHVGVKSGDCFTIEEGKVHQLENTGPLPMVITIVCPAAHIGHDRFMVKGEPDQ
jgi:mannose-6-phosphate isomerase-like protein (cupin superfamily)